MVVGPDGVARDVFHAWVGRVRVLYETTIRFSRTGGAGSLTSVPTVAHIPGEDNEQDMYGKNDYYRPFSISWTLARLVAAWKV